MQLPVHFPTEAGALRQHLRTEQGLSPTQRLRAVADAVAATEALSQAGQLRHAQLRQQQQLEEDWHRRMQEFLKQHVSA